MAQSALSDCYVAMLTTHTTATTTTSTATTTTYTNISTATSTTTITATTTTISTAETVTEINNDKSGGAPTSVIRYQGVANPDETNEVNNTVVDNTNADMLHEQEQVHVEEPKVSEEEEEEEKGLIEDVDKAIDALICVDNHSHEDDDKEHQILNVKYNGLKQSEHYVIDLCGNDRYNNRYNNKNNNNNNVKNTGNESLLPSSTISLNETVRHVFELETEMQAEQLMERERGDSVALPPPPLPPTLSSTRRCGITRVSSAMVSPADPSDDFNDSSVCYEQQCEYTQASVEEEEQQQQPHTLPCQYVMAEQQQHQTQKRQQQQQRYDNCLAHQCYQVSHSHCVQSRAATEHEFLNEQEVEEKVFAPCQYQHEHQQQEQQQQHQRQYEYDNEYNQPHQQLYFYENPLNLTREEPQLYGLVQQQKEQQFQQQQQQQQLPCDEFALRQTPPPPYVSTYTTHQYQWYRPQYMYKQQYGQEEQQQRLYQEQRKSHQLFEVPSQVPLQSRVPQLTAQETKPTITATTKAALSPTLTTTSTSSIKALNPTSMLSIPSLSQLTLQQQHHTQELLTSRTLMHLRQSHMPSQLQQISALNELEPVSAAPVLNLNIDMLASNDQRSFDIRVRPAEPSFSHITVPMVRNRIHILKDSPGYRGCEIIANYGTMQLNHLQHGSVSVTLANGVRSFSESHVIPTSSNSGGRVTSLPLSLSLLPSSTTSPNETVRHVFELESEMQAEQHSERERGDSMALPLASPPTPSLPRSYGITRIASAMADSSDGSIDSSVNKFHRHDCQMGPSLPKRPRRFDEDSFEDAD